MYCVELNVLKWCYSTALEAYHNKHLQVRLCPPMHLNSGSITGIKSFEEFKHYLDDDALLQFHALRVYKVNNIISTNKDPQKG